MQLMGYWGHKPPPVARDCPQGTKLRRRESAADAAGVGKQKDAKKPPKKPKKTSTEKTTTDKSSKRKSPSHDSGDESSDRGLQGSRSKSREEDSSESDVSCSEGKVACTVVKKTAVIGAGNKPSRQRGRGEKKAKKTPQFLLHGRRLGVPISVNEEAERPYLGTIIKEDLDLNQLLVHFKEDGDEMWYDKDEVK